MTDLTWRRGLQGSSSEHVSTEQHFTRPVHERIIAYIEQERSASRIKTVTQ